MVNDMFLKKNSMILTPRELEVIKKKLSGAKITQQDSNYLSKYVRPKLREITMIDAKMLLEKLEYNQKVFSIENKIKKIILKNIKEISSIVIYGSAIQNDYNDYNDIDILIITKKRLYKTLGEKHKKILEIKKELESFSILADIQIYDNKTLENNYPHSPTLIYQLKDHKVIYGELKLPDKIELYNANLQMKLDWSDIEDIEPEGIDIYKALRNVILVRLLINKIIDNKVLKESLYKEVGENLIQKLKNNQESKIERKLALNYLKELSEKTRKQLRGDLWEKIEL